MVRLRGRRVKSPELAAARDGDTTTTTTTRRRGRRAVSPATTNGSAASASTPRASSKGSSNSSGSGSASSRGRARSNSPVTDGAHPYHTPDQLLETETSAADDFVPADTYGVRNLADPEDVADDYGRPKGMGDGVALVSNKERFQEYVKTASKFFRSTIDTREKPRQVVFMVLLLGLIGYVGYERTNDGVDGDADIRAAAFSLAAVLMVYCFLQTRDGLLLRPHPAVWRMVHAAGLCYVLFMSVLVVLPTAHARMLINRLFPWKAFTDHSEIPATGDQDNCGITVESVWGQVKSIWFTAHLVGWWGKMCVFRDFRFCLWLSALFELAELTFQFVIPDFKECWWDSLFMDFLGANLLGILAGSFTLQWLDSKEFNFIAHRSYVKGDKGRLGRVLWRFTPFSWSKFQWDALGSPGRFAQLGVTLFVALLVELNAFFLIYALDLPKNSKLNHVRLMLYFLMSLPSISEMYVFISKPGMRIGQNAWVLTVGVSLEMLAYIKHGADQFLKVPPTDVLVAWGLFLAMLAAWAALFFKTGGPNAYKRELRERRRLAKDQNPWEEFMYEITPRTRLDFLLFACFVPLLLLLRRWNWGDITLFGLVGAGAAPTAAERMAAAAAAGPGGAM